MPDPFQVSITLHTPLLPAGNEPRLIYFLLEISPNAHLPLRRTPVNLALVVDRKSVV